MIAVENKIVKPIPINIEEIVINSNLESVVPKIHRSESYRRIVEAAEEEVDALGFFDRFKPTVKFVNIERVPRSKSVKMYSIN